jgi:hypothetical protein
MILGLRTVIYPAPELQKAKRWYSELLMQSPYFDEPFYVGFSVGGFELGLVPEATPGTSGAQPLWGVQNAEAAYARLVELGATPLEPVTAVGEGIKVGAVKDPSATDLESLRTRTSMLRTFGEVPNPFAWPRH